MLALLFISVELLPVLMKLLLNFSPPSTYDRLSSLRDDGDVSVEELQQEARREVEQAQQELLVLAEKERVDRQKAAILARRRTAPRVVAAAPAPDAAASEPVRDPAPVPSRRMWDTSPIRLARSAAGRTVRSVRRRPAGRVSA
jgi:hypothetical protein